MRHYSPCDFFVLRTPLKSVEEVIELNDLFNLEGEVAFLDKLKKLFEDPLLLEAIYLASPELYSSTKKWIAGEVLEKKKQEKISLALYKYFCRMATRPTPYGLFAGYADGQLTTHNTEVTFATDSLQKQSRLDMNAVAKLSTHLLSIPQIAEQLLFYPNTSLYKIGDSYRYAESRLQDRKRSYCLTSVTYSPYLDKVVTYAKGGKTIESLTKHLQSESVNADLALGYIKQLIDAQLLVSELEPTLTGEDFFAVLSRKLAAFKGTKNYQLILQKIQHHLTDQTEDIGKYLSINDLINKNFFETEQKDLIQTNLFFNTTTNRLNGQVVDKTLQQVEKLLRFETKAHYRSLEAFRKRFSERYDQQEVSLTTALDSETGVGYGLSVTGQSEFMPLLHQLAIPGTDEPNQIEWDALTRFKFNKLNEARLTQTKTLLITDNDLDTLGKPVESTGLYDSAVLFGSLLAESTVELDKGNFKFVLKAFFGPSAANLLARFCPDNSTLSDKVKQCLQDEEANHPDALFAEIVHLPEARIGNVLQRPKLRSYEIPYLGQASVPETHQISVDDLVVSVREGRVILRSKQHGREVIPRLSSAHLFGTGLPVYRFLCDLQCQSGFYASEWKWGCFEKEAFLPRVVYRNIILSRARWRLLPDDHKSAIEKLNSYELGIYFSKLTHQLGLPRYVTLGSHDNELMIDLTCGWSLQILRDYLVKGPLVLQEYLGAPDQCFLTKEGKHVTSEVIIPLRKLTVSPTVPQHRPKVLTSIRRSFLPGSEWLYIKVYVGNKTGDKILTQTVGTLANKFYEQGWIDRWFFLRYNDPDPHLRVRFHCPNGGKNIAELLHHIQQAVEPFLQEGLLQKIQIDTYVRELERYGGNQTMELSEEVFYRDSQAVYQFLDLLEGDLGETYRWQFALRGIDSMLTAFGYSLAEKFNLISQLQAGFFAEFNGTERFKHSLNEQYRKKRAVITAILQPDITDPDLQIAIDCFVTRERQLACIANQLKGELFDSQVSLDFLLPSYMHMFLNRMFLAKQRLHELVIYHFLAKYYESMLAQLQKASRSHQLTAAN
ncbi:lantibiotic dehydratase [Spirosoma sp.]|uniref:lantibiotic dehydratase n=1 Tax=Spirosoma sp. TaxID=1899569 RepID=UPI002614A481|nr:lantibiotic dehydratase [Spirosoma sp.]MCX6212985.1 lantibiotic dehydratase [Spirosoma sp.]